MKKKILQKMIRGGDQASDSVHFREHLDRKLCKVYDHFSNNIQSSLSFLADHLEEVSHLIEWARAAETDEEFLQRYKKTYKQACRALSLSCKVNTWIVNLLLSDEMHAEQEHSEYARDGTWTAYQPPCKLSWKGRPWGRQGESPWEMEGVIPEDALGDAPGYSEKAATSGICKIDRDGKASKSLMEADVLDQVDVQSRRMKPMAVLSHDLSSSSLCSEFGPNSSISLSSRKLISPRSSGGSPEDLRAVKSCNSENIKAAEIMKEGSQKNFRYNLPSKVEISEKETASHPVGIQESSSVSCNAKEADEKMEEGKKKVAKDLGWMEFCDRREKSCRKKDMSMKVSSQDDRSQNNSLHSENSCKEKVKDLQGKARWIAVSKENSNIDIGTQTKNIERLGIPKVEKCERHSSEEKSLAGGGECCWKDGHSTIVKNQEQKSESADSFLDLEYLSVGAGSPLSSGASSVRSTRLPNSIPVDEVPIGQAVDVVVSHIEDPITVWVQRCDCRLEDFQSSLNHALLKDSEPLKKIPSIGEIVAATFSSDRAFYRAKVLAVKEGGDVFTVQFLDYGNKDDVLFDDLRVLPNSFWEFPCAGFRCHLHGLDEVPDGDSGALVQELENWTANIQPMKATFYEVTEAADIEEKCLKLSLELQNGWNLMDIYPSVCHKSCIKDVENASCTGVTTDGESERQSSLLDFDSESITSPPQPPRNVTMKLSSSLVSCNTVNWEPLSEEQMDQAHPKWFRSSTSARPKVYVTDSSGAVWVQQEEQMCGNMLGEEDKGSNTGISPSCIQGSIFANEEEFPGLSRTASNNKGKKKKTGQSFVDTVSYQSWKESGKHNSYEGRISSKSPIKTGAVADTGTVCEKLPHIFLEPMPVSSMGKEVMARIAYINNPNHFYVHLVDSEANQIASFQEHLKEFYEGLDEEFPCTMLPCGTYWAVRNQDGHWYRCKVIENKITSNQEEPYNVELLLVDHGPVITASVKDVRVLREEFTLSPAFAIPCTLNALYPLEGNCWPKEIIELFQQQCGSKDELFLLQFLKKRLCGAYSVVLKKLDGEPLNEMLKMKGVASHKPGVEVRVQQETRQNSSREDLKQDWDPMASEFLSRENNLSSSRECAEIAFTNYSSTDEKRLCKFYRVGKCCPRGDACRWEHTRMREGGVTTEKQPAFCSLQYDLELPEVNTFVYIIVSSITSLSQFHVFMPHGPRFWDKQGADSGTDSGYEGETLKTFSKNLREYYATELPVFSQSATAPGEVWIYREDSGQCWRVRVIEVNRDASEVQVYYIDLGGTEWIAEDNLLPMKVQFMHFPEQAIECYLAGVSDAVPEGYYEVVMQRFVELTEGRTLIAHVSDVQENEGRLGLELFDTSVTPDTINISQEILKLMNAL